MPHPSTGSARCLIIGCSIVGPRTLVSSPTPHSSNLELLKALAIFILHAKKIQNPPRQRFVHYSASSTREVMYLVAVRLLIAKLRGLRGLGGAKADNAKCSIALALRWDRKLAGITAANRSSRKGCSPGAEPVLRSAAPPKVRKNREIQYPFLRPQMVPPTSSALRRHWRRIWDMFKIRTACHPTLPWNIESKRISSESSPCTPRQT